MKHRAIYRRRSLPTLFLGLTVGLPASLSLAQPAPAPASAPAAGPVLPPEPASLPAGLAAKTALTDSDKKLVEAFVKGHFARLATNDGVAAVTSRKKLESGAGTPASPTSAAFQTVYASAINAEANAALKSPDIRYRVSAMVVVDRIATLMPHQSLAPAVINAMGARQNEAVIQLGVRAARGVYPTVLTGNQGAAIVNAVVSAVYAYPDQTSLAGEAIAIDAFETLASDALTGSTAAAPSRQAALNGVVALSNARAAGWAKADPVNQATIPADPALENSRIVYVYQMWPNMTPQQQALAGRALLDIATEGTRLAPLIPPKPPGQVEGVDPRQIVTLVRNALGAIQVAARNAGVVEVETAAAAAGKNVNVPFNGALVAAEIVKLEAAMKTANMLADKPSPVGPPPGVLPPPAAPKPNPPAPAGTKPVTKPGTPAAPVPGRPVAGGGAAPNK